MHKTGKESVKVKEEAQKKELGRYRKTKKLHGQYTKEQEPNQNNILGATLRGVYSCFVLVNSWVRFCAIYAQQT
jgi:hypothetical protein